MRQIHIPPAELMEAESESRLPPGAGIFLAVLASALFWVFVAALYWGA
ncbi:hypothetical protein [Sphingomonas sp. DG1-23]|nr:hypothetical protein [Sphingomonas sp. DG1-23]